jgi:hypothetical protein
MPAASAPVTRTDPRAHPASALRVADPVASLPNTPRRILAALRDGGPQTVEQLRGRLRGRTPRPATVLAALATLRAADLAVEDPPGWWIACEPPSRDDLLGQLRLRGPHDLRHTFATWLKDAGIPARVIDELMGHAGGRRGGGAPSHDGSLIGTRYRWTTRRWRRAWWPRARRQGGVPCRRPRRDLERERLVGQRLQRQQLDRHHLDRVDVVRGAGGPARSGRPRCGRVVGGRARPGPGADGPATAGPAPAGTSHSEMEQRGAGNIPPPCARAVAELRCWPACR